MSLYESIVTDFSDVVQITPSMELYLKPIAKIHITVSLPKLKVAGQTISNWDLQQKLKALCEPLVLKSFTVSKSTMEYIRFESEVNTKSSIRSFISALNYRSLKLVNFPETLRVTCSEAKTNFPTRQDWDEYFGDSEIFDETRPGERPDTVHMSGVPCKFFADPQTQIVNPAKVEELFKSFGEIRNIDIPILDPYRSDLQESNKKSFKPFSYDSQLFFEMFIQFDNYKGFAACMKAFRGMKLLMKENGENAIAANIKVDFDRTKHLSDQSIESRQLEKEKIEKLQKLREEAKRKEREEAEQKRLLELRRKQEEEREEEMRRQRREEKKKRKKKEKKAKLEEQRAILRIAKEERRLLVASRRLEAIRLITHLSQRLQKEIEEEKKKKRQNLDQKKRNDESCDREKRIREHLKYKEHEVKSRILKRKLVEEYKHRDRNKNHLKSAPSRHSDRDGRTRR